MSNAALSEEVIVFLHRAAPHFMAGKSVEDSMRAVLDDDARLIAAAFKRSTSEFFPTADERGISRMRPDQIGDVIFAEISRSVYSRIKDPTA